MSTSTDDGPKLEGENLVELDNPCSVMSESLTQSLTSIEVNGVERFFRLSAPKFQPQVHNFQSLLHSTEEGVLVKISNSKLSLTN